MIPMSSQVRIAEPRLNAERGRVTSGLNRVGFDGRWYNDSGVGSYVVGLLRALAVTPRKFELIVYEDPQNRIPGLEGLPVTRKDVRSQKYSPLAQWEFRSRASQDGLDLFHSPFYDVPLIVGCPVIATIHDLIPFFFRIYAWPKQQMIRAGYRIAARRAQHFLSVSLSTARTIEELLNVEPAQISVVHNGVADDSFHPYAEPGESDLLKKRYGLRPPFVLVASARNWRTKNLEGAFRALGSAQRLAGMKFQTVVFGPPNGVLAACGRDELRESNLVCTGYLPLPALAAAFRHAAAFVMPSLYEGFGLPVLESMACGCPVITSNRGALPEIAAGGAQIFDPADCDGMGRALAGLLINSSLREYWRERALCRAADFSWKETARKTIAAYNCAWETSRSERKIREQRD